MHSRDACAPVVAGAPTASAPTGCRRPCVLDGVFVTVRAMCLSPILRSQGIRREKKVVPRGHDPKMLRINASTVLADVMYLEPRWYRADEQFVGDAMSAQMPRLAAQRFRHLRVADTRVTSFPSPAARAADDELLVLFCSRNGSSSHVPDSNAQIGRSEYPKKRNPSITIRRRKRR